MAKKKRKSSAKKKKSNSLLKYLGFALFALALFSFVFLGHYSKNRQDGELKEVQGLTTSQKAGQPQLVLSVPIKTSSNITYIATNLKSLVKPTDELSIGMGSYSLDTVNTLANQARTEFPNNIIRMSTSPNGFYTKVQPGTLSSNVSGITIDYEISTFEAWKGADTWKWDFQTNLTYIRQLMKDVRAYGRNAGLVPTAVSLERTTTERASDVWQYGTVTRATDYHIPQTQGYCFNGDTAMENAMKELKTQHEAVNAPFKKVKILIALDGPNVPVSPQVAYGCSKIALKYGFNNISIKADDPAKIDAYLKMVRESIKPTISITSPLANQTVSGTAPVTVNASDNVGITKVDFYLDGTYVGTSDTAPYTYNLNLYDVVLGNHSVRARAYDIAGNNTNSSTIRFRVGKAASPTPTPTVAPRNNDVTKPVVTISNLPTTLSVGSEVRIKISGTDDQSIKLGALYINGQKQRSASPQEPTNSFTFYYTWKTAGLTPGAYKVEGDIQDEAGNRGTTSINVTLQ